MNDYKNYLDDGIYDIQCGKYKDGIEKINQSLELKNDWEIPYFYRAVAHQALENFDDAILDYTKSIQINDKMTDAYYNRANISFALEYMDEAIADYSEALRLQPDMADAYFNRGLAYLKKGDEKRAREDLSRAGELGVMAAYNILKRMGE